MKRALAITAILLGCDGDDAASPDAPDDLIVDSDAIYLDSDDVDSLLDSGRGDDVDDVIDPDADFGVPDGASGPVLSTTLVDFGAVAIGGPSVERSVLLINDSDFSVLVGQTDVVGAGFTLASTTCGMEVPPHLFCDLVLVAAPATVGEQSGQLLVRTDLVTLIAELRATGVQ